MYYQGHHRYLLVKILKTIFTDQALAHLLGFKGGTAAMFFYGLPRFSTDLDFDLLDQADVREVFNILRELLQGLCIVKKADNKRYTLFYLLSYEGKQAGAPNIKVEICKRALSSSYDIKHYLGIPMQVMTKPDMAAHKLLAMYNRLGYANRDIFDVWYFLHNRWPVNTAIIESHTNDTYSVFLAKCIEALEKYNDNQILTGLGELLTLKQRAWVQKDLKNETLFLLRFSYEQSKE